jgi:hypothetical protein
VRLGDQQAGGPAGGAGPQPPGLDQQHGAQACLVAGGRSGHAEYAAPDHQDVGALTVHRPVGAAQRRPFLAGELIPPDGAANRHDPILGDVPCFCVTCAA